MTVQDLIDYLSDLDPDAEVHILHNPHGPYEYDIDFVMAREEFDGRDDLEPTDVLIGTGSRVRDGDNNAWKLTGSF